MALLVSFPFSPKFMKSLCLIKCIVTQILSIHQCGFQQGHTTNYSLLLMVEKLKKSLGNSGLGGMLLTDQKHLTVWDTT